MNLGDFSARTSIEDTDRIIGHRGTSAGGESAWTGATLKAQIAAIAAQVNGGSGLTVVSMPVDSNATGALGQIAVGGGKLAVYVGVSGGPKWVFLDFYQIN